MKPSAQLHTQQTSLRFLLEWIRPQSLLVVDGDESGLSIQDHRGDLARVSTYSSTPCDISRAAQYGTKAIDPDSPPDLIFLGGDVHPHLLQAWIDAVLKLPSRDGRKPPGFLWQIQRFPPFVQELDSRQDPFWDEEGVSLRYRRIRAQGLLRVAEEGQRRHRVFGTAFSSPDSLALGGLLFSQAKGSGSVSVLAQFLESLSKHHATGMTGRGMAACFETLGKSVGDVTSPWLLRKTSRWLPGNPIRKLKRTLRDLRGDLQNSRPLIGTADQAIQRVGEKASNPSLAVTYLLPQVAVNGGVLGVTQLVGELRKLGLRAGIATLRVKSKARAWPLGASPWIFSDEQQLIREIPEADLVIATHWSTARWAREIVNRGRARTSVYFLQDYEAWFFPDDPMRQREVIKTYDWIPHRIVKSNWLAGLLQRDGFTATKIHLGMNLGVFYPRSESRVPKSLFSMLRFSTPRRGSENTVRAVAKVMDRQPKIKVSFFGEDLRQAKIPFEFTSLGATSDQDELARMYSRCEVFIDGSKFQAFGRPALEAMACGCACVLTDTGGVREYARHEENCLLVPPDDPVALALAIERLLVDDDLRSRIQQEALRTVAGFSLQREGVETKRAFEEIIQGLE